MLHQKQGIKLSAFNSSAQREAFWAEPKQGPAPGQYTNNDDLADATTPLEIVGKSRKARV